MRTCASPYSPIPLAKTDITYFRPREAGANVAKTSNPNAGVGGTAQDGGLSTAATAADGGPDVSVG